MERDVRAAMWGSTPPKAGAMTCGAHVGVERAEETEWVGCGAAGEEAGAALWRCGTHPCHSSQHDQCCFNMGRPPPPPSSPALPAQPAFTPAASQPSLARTSVLPALEDQKGTCGAPSKYSWTCQRGRGGGGGLRGWGGVAGQGREAGRQAGTAMLGPG